MGLDRRSHRRDSELLPRNPHVRCIRRALQGCEAIRGIRPQSVHRHAVQRRIGPWSLQGRDSNPCFRSFVRGFSDEHGVLLLRKGTVRALLRGQQDSVSEDQRHPQDWYGRSGAVPHGRRRLRALLRDTPVALGPCGGAHHTEGGGRMLHRNRK